jgi:hypothetical protein
VNESRRPPLLYVLVTLLFAEAALLFCAAIYLVIEIVVGAPGSFVSALALAICALLAGAGMTAVARAALAGRAWSRGAAVVWQVLQIAVAVSAFTGDGARPDIGIALLVPALAVLLLLFTRSVMAATNGR